MKVVLLKSIDNLGQAGQTAEVKPGYFRNFLEPREMALKATKANLNFVESRRKNLDALVAREISDAKSIQEKLDGATVNFTLLAGETGRLFGSVTARDVIQKIKDELNIEVERRKIEMENVKSLGDHQVRIRIYPGVAANVNVHVDAELPESLKPKEGEAQEEESGAEEEAEEKHDAAAAWVAANADDPESDEEDEGNE